MKRIYIASPTGVATGGTELLQQLCFHLNKLGLNANMFYLGEYENSPVQIKFLQYNNPYADYVVDDKENILVLPETCMKLMYKFKKVQLYVWWLSVNNYTGYNSKNINVKLKDIINTFKFRKIKNLVQSEYAKNYLMECKKVDKEKILYLSDYLNNCYFYDKPSNIEKTDTILYNPKKGFEFTKLLIENIQEYTWVPLINLSNEEMRNLLNTSKVYVDFGNHPGKDRIPREAAISGCCVITGKKGAANNSIDIPISNEFKFDDKISSIDAIHKKITECMENYIAMSRKFEGYRDIINHEEENFINDVYNIFKNNAW